MTEQLPAADAPLIYTSRGRVAANIASNYAVLAAQVGFLLAMTPYIVHRLGAPTFGAWAIALAVAGYLRLLDLGISPATARFVAAAKDSAALSAVADTSITVLSGIALLALAAGLGVAVASPSLFPHVEGLQAALFVTAVSTAIQIPLAAFANVLFGLQRIAERNAAVLVRVLASIVAIVAVVESGGGLVAFVLAVACVEVAVAVGQALYCVFAIPGLRLRFPVVERTLLREFGSFSLAILGLSVATQLAFYSDGIVIGIALTATAVAVYTVAMRVVDGASQLLSQFSDVFMPVFARAEAFDQAGRARAILDVGTRATLVVGYPFVATLIGLAEPLVVAWLGDSFRPAWIPLALLAGGLAFGAPLRFGVLWAIAAARHRRVALYALLDSLLNIGLSIALVGPLDINGVALATLIALALSNGWFMPRVIYAAAGMSWAREYVRPVLVAAVVASPLALVLRFIVAPALPETLAAALPVAAAAVLAGVAVEALVLLTRDERRAVGAILRRARA
jgi:O-antigen/teichoic acid export membrane protein